MGEVRGGVSYWTSFMITESSTKILAPKTISPKSPYTETKCAGIRMCYRYKPESVETKMADGPYMGEPAPNRG